MIRKAVLMDVPEIVELGMEFARLSKAAHIMDADRIKVHELALRAVEDPNSILIVWEQHGRVQGVVFGFVAPSFFSDQLLLQEMVLYSRQPRGLSALLEAFEQAGIERGAKKFIVGAKPDYCNLEKFYTRRGYKIFEEQYIKSGG